MDLNRHDIDHPAKARFGLSLALAGALMLGGLAAMPTAALAEEQEPVAEEAADSDPFEGINRVTSGVNRALRTMFIGPLAEFWTKLTPPPMQEVVRNAASNLTEPVTIASSLIQGDTENAGIATQRFFMNTTLGLGGARDVATDKGIVGRQEDFGQAAAANGVAAGPHLVLPILGPSNTRDAFFDVVNGLVNPLSIAEGVDKAITYADNKDSIDAISNTSVDPYTAERIAWEQHREFQILNGEVTAQDGPSFD